jgi:tetratricopeptide (TPR) repeat protein
VHVHYAYQQCAKAVEAGLLAVALRQERGELYDACDDYWAIMLSLNSMGRLHEALEMAQTLDTLATRVGHLSSRWNVQWTRTWVHFVTAGDLARSEALSRRDLDDAGRTNPVWRGLNHTMLGLVRFYAGDWPAARSEFDAAVGLNFESFADRFYPSVGLLERAYAGERDALEPLQSAASNLLRMPEENPIGVWEQLLSVVEGLTVLGHGKDTAELYPLVLKGIKNGVMLSYGIRLWQMVAGIAAAAGGHRDAALEHFETALKQAHELPHKIAQPEVRRWYAQTLLGDDTPGARDKARRLLGEAVEMYQTIGMPRHVEMAKELHRKT